MKRYIVNIPIAGFVSVDVEAENEKDAIEKAFDSEELDLKNCEEWEAFSQLCEGNILNAYHYNKPCVYEQPGGDE